MHSKSVVIGWRCNWPDSGRAVNWASDAKNLIGFCTALKNSSASHKAELIFHRQDESCFWARDMNTGKFIRNEHMGKDYFVSAREVTEQTYRRTASDVTHFMIR
jgi:hypothetical protein